MSVSGPIVHQQLMHAYQEVQHELESARGHVAAAGAELTDLSEDRGDVIVDLAQFYLPELTHEAIRSTWKEVQAAVGGVLSRKEQHAQRLVQRLDELTSARQAAETNLQRTSENLDQATELQGETAAAISNELAADAGFKMLSDRAAEAEAALQRAEANLAEIEQDVRRKLPSYENSSMFMYLFKRGFLTPAYEHRGMTRSMDQWLGRYINYRDAKQGYEFLKSTPVHMKEVIAEDRLALNTVLDELEQQRDAVAERRGLPQVIQKVTELTNARQTLLAELERIETETKSAQAERSEIENSRGPYYHEAIQRFRDMLAASDHSSLANRARQTPEIEDDQIVARLQGLSSEMDQIGQQVRQRQQRIEQLTGHLQSVGSLISRFRAAGYDSSRAEFTRNDDIVEMLRAVREGRGSYEDVWQSLRRSFRNGPSAMDQFTRAATHPMTQVLINAMAHAAAGALESQARQAGQRRSSSRPSRSGGNFGGGFGGGFSSKRGGGGGDSSSGGFKNREVI
jgi:chromosome segregation ATPase